LLFQRLRSLKRKAKKEGKINQKEYKPKADEFIKRYPICQANIDGVCKKISVCVHHKRGKHSTEDLLDENYFLAVCLPCHEVIEKNPAWAKQQGFSVSRLSPKKKTA
jgi:hypothetical protein